MNMRRLLTILLVAALAGCGPTISYDVKVKHNVLVETDYSRLRTYQWVPLSQTVNAAEMDVNTLASLKIAFTDAFDAKGYMRVKGNPDFVSPSTSCPAGRSSPPTGGTTTGGTGGAGATTRCSGG